MNLRIPSVMLVLTVMLLFVLSLPGIADARGGGRGGGGGGRGGGGGGGGGRSFSRSSPASGGSFSSRSAVSQRPAQSSSRKSGIQQRSSDTRSTARQERQGQRQEGSGERKQARQDNQGDRQGNRDDAREDWQNQRNQAREDWQDFAEDEDWDDHYGHHDDWDEGDAFVAGAVVGVTAGAIAASAAQPTYVTTLPCATTAVIVNGATYYNCNGTWYNRGYSSGTVVYVVTGAP